MLVEDGSGRSVSDFLCRNNIFLFLHALASPHNFNFEQDLLFDPEDLYLCRDIGKVFRLLSELSHHEKVLNSGFAGFPRKEKQLHKVPFIYYLSLGTFFDPPAQHVVRILSNFLIFFQPNQVLTYYMNGPLATEK